MSLNSAERLHRFKCAYCGSKDKNISNIKVQDDRYNSEEKCTAIKIVTCNQCGYSMFFGHSSYVIARILTGSSVSMKASEEFVEKFHMENHEDPRRNPHTGEVPPNSADTR